MKSVKFFFKKPVNLFYLISFAGIAGFFICACFARRGTTLFDWLAMEGNSKWALSDFSRHVGYAAKLSRVYYGSFDACFPPLSYIFFHFIYAVNPVTIRMNLWYRNIFQIKYAPLVYIMWTLLQSIVMVYIVKKKTRLSMGRAITLTLLLLFSMPFFTGALERGNPVFVTLIFLCAALYLRDESKVWQRELALVFIACAAGFKITPCVMGLLYIKEKRWTEARRLFIYGTILFFLPFIFTGGVNGFKKFLEILSAHEAIQTTAWTSFPGFVRWWAIKLFGYESVLAERLVKAAFVILMLGFAFLTRERWKTVLYLVMIMAYAHALSFRYYTIYLMLPLLCLISETRKNRNNSIDVYIYHVLFALVFTIPVWGIGGDPEHWVCGAAYLLCFRAMVTDIQQLMSERWNKTAQPDSGTSIMS